jgi:hypothetical protein
MLKTIGFFTIPLEYDYSTILKLKENIINVHIMMHQILKQLLNH